MKRQGVTHSITADGVAAPAAVTHSTMPAALKIPSSPNYVCTLCLFSHFLSHPFFLFLLLSVPVCVHVMYLKSQQQHPAAVIHVEKVQNLMNIQHAWRKFEWKKEIKERKN